MTSRTLDDILWDSKESGVEARRVQVIGFQDPMVMNGIELVHGVKDCAIAAVPTTHKNKGVTELVVAARKGVVEGRSVVGGVVRGGM